MLPKIYSALALGLLVELIPVCNGQAQVRTAISSDGTLGTTVTQSGSVYDITDGTHKGANLFHSFGLFSVGTGDTANFLNNGGAPITNILSRVTGGQISNIFGTLKSTGFPGASLFLMNPAGMIVGPDAALDVSGGVHLTTADFLRLSDAAEFTALPEPADSVLTTASVEAFGFVSSNPSPIEIEQSSLEGFPGEVLSLVAGNIKVTGGSLNAPNGQVVLASMAGPGTIVLRENLGFAVEAEQFGDIDLTEGASVISGGEQGGGVVIRSGTLMIRGSSVSASRTIPADGTGNDYGHAKIYIDVAEQVLLDNGATIQTNVFTSTDNTFESDGISVKADQVEVGNASSIQSFASGASTGGKGGDIVVKANSILIRDPGTQIGTQAGGSAYGGDIFLRGSTENQMPDVTLRDFSFVQTQALSGSGNAGRIEVNGGNVLITGGFSAFQSLAFSPATGNAGNVRVTANSLRVEGGAIASFSLFGVGNAGNVDVTVNRGNVFVSGGAISANTFGSGAAGTVQVTADNLELANGTSIQSAAGGFGTGNAKSVTVILTGDLAIRAGAFLGVFSVNADAEGDLNITAKDISITGFHEATNPLDPQFLTGIRTLAGNGQGGNVSILADNLQVTQNAVINSATTGSGAAGDITAELNGRLQVNNGSRIVASTTGSGGAGDITVSADSVQLSGRTLDQGVISALTRGTGTGGDISIKAGHISLNNSAAITAEATATGNAGNINLTAIRNGSIRIIDSAITAEALQASGGNIKLTAPNQVLIQNSTISTSVQGGPGTVGGNIDIDPTSVVCRACKIIAQAVAGQGGNISITTDLFLADANSLISASSQFGLSGTVTIQSPIQNLSGTLAPMPEAPLQAAALLRAACAARMQGGQASSFVQSGRGGPASEPGGWLASPMLAAASPSVPASPSISPGADGGAVAVAESDPTPNIRSTPLVSPETHLLAPDGHLVCSL